jgi:hypothetical protein
VSFSFVIYLPIVACDSHYRYLSQPCTSTSRPGRWRSFPYLAELEGPDADALWGYLCQEWDRENHADEFPGRKLIKYNFFMLQADVLPNMGFSPTRKRLIQSYDCVPTENATENSFEQDDNEQEKQQQEEDHTEQHEEL